MWAGGNNSELVIVAAIDSQDSNTSSKIREGVDIPVSFGHIQYSSVAGESVLQGAKDVLLIWPSLPFAGSCTVWVQFPSVAHLPWGGPLEGEDVRSHKAQDGL